MKRNAPARWFNTVWIGVLFSTNALALDRVAEVIVLTDQGGEQREDLEIKRWQERARRESDKADAYDRLGWAYVAKARRTLDVGYYKLAEKTADARDARFGASDESRLLRGHVLHNLHRFREAESLARELAQRRALPNDYALLSDVLMEQGKLAGAVDALQRMVNLKPGLESYSRIAHLRWLKGDLPGAVDAMEQAAKAGDPREAETYAWTLARLSGYYLQQGKTTRALLVADSATKTAPDYAPALLARGRALLVEERRRSEAVVDLRRAAELNPLPEYQWWLADALQLAREEGEARRIEAKLKSRGAVSDPRTYALFLATRGDSPATAVNLAREELANRPDVFTQDALAWALANVGDYSAASQAIRLALAENTKDARLLWHAGEIALGRGERDLAQSYFSQALPLAGTLTPSERDRLRHRVATSGVAQVK